MRGNDNGVPACAGMTVRGNENGVPACAGMTIFFVFFENRVKTPCFDIILWFTFGGLQNYKASLLFKKAFGLYTKIILYPYGKP
jgi:hypothetical protein